MDFEKMLVIAQGQFGANCPGGGYQKYDTEGNNFEEFLYDYLENEKSRGKVSDFSIESGTCYDDPGGAGGYIVIAWIDTENGKLNTYAFEWDM